jgi:hypothetical protein
VGGGTGKQKLPPRMEQPQQPNFAWNNFNNPISSFQGPESAPGRNLSMSEVMVNCNEMVSDEEADETCNL